MDKQFQFILMILFPAISAVVSLMGFIVFVKSEQFGAALFVFSSLCGWLLCIILVASIFRNE